MSHTVIEFVRIKEFKGFLVLKNQSFRKILAAISEDRYFFSLNIVSLRKS